MACFTARCSTVEGQSLHEKLARECELPVAERDGNARVGAEGETELSSPQRTRCFAASCIRAYAASAGAA